jgi:hypothetical protein
VVARRHRGATAVRRFVKLLSAVAILILTILAASRVCAQSQPYERVYQHPKSEVDRVLQQIHASLGGRLPVLDGFVDTTQDLNRYSQGYYQCSVQVAPVGSGATSVRVTAKITAWYAGSGAASGDYRVLPSNGRIETDLLDRLEEALGGRASMSKSEPQRPGAGDPKSTSPAPTADPGPAPTSSASAATVPASANQPNVSKSSILRSLPPVGVSGVPAAPLVNPEASPPPSEDLDSLREKREQAERREQELSADVKNLEEIQRDQAHPADLAIVKRSGTPVWAAPESNARVLFRAEAEDEFPIIEKQTNWVHVQISGDSRGWIRRTEVDSADALAEPSKATATGSTSEEPAFRVAREETNLFPGKWEPLHGKTVKIIWVEPSSGSTTSRAEAKRSFAKSLFLKAYQEISAANQQVDGVVIVFDSADGGQVSATLAALKQWQAGSLSEAAFWKQCALDPPELLQDPSKGSGDHL